MKKGLRITIFSNWINTLDSPLATKCESKEWSCHNLAIEVGARGMVSRWFHLAMSNIGIKGRAFSRVKNDASKECFLF